MKLKDKSDHALIEAEKIYIEALHKEYFDRIYSVAKRELRGFCSACVEDVVDETFVRACENFHEMSAYHPAVNWLIGTCRNIAGDERKHYRRIAMLSEDDIRAELQKEFGLDYVLPKWVKESDREILRRFYEYRDTTEEIAKDLGMTPVNVRQRLSRLRKRLKENL